jgi:hypothetical protein
LQSRVRNALDHRKPTSALPHRVARPDADVERRELLRPGMGKVFKQILDAQVKAA